MEESARILDVKPKKKPRNLYRNRKKPARTEKPYRKFVRQLVVNWYIPLLKRWFDILGIGMLIGLTLLGFF